MCIMSINFQNQKNKEHFTDEHIEKERVNTATILHSIANDS